MQLALLKAVVSGARAWGSLAKRVTGIVYDSRKVKPGDLFVALAGSRADGHRFVHDAVAAGAAAVMVDRRVPDLAVPQLVVSDTRAVLGRVSARFFNHPSRRVRVIGVTGTNGKTTTTHLIRSILECAGFRTGLIGTMYYIVGDREIPAPNTTPESLTVQELLAQMADRRMTHAVMEVSSHSLEQHRVEDVEFAAGVFTNLSPEHLDFHRTMRAYARAKARLFEALDVDAPAAVNADDRWCDVVTRAKRANRFRYALTRKAEVKVVDLDATPRGSRFAVASPWGRFEVRTVLPARHNVYNCLAAATVTAALGVELDDVVEGIAKVSCVRGRLEPVDAGQDFTVLVDYAHTTAALRSVLKAVRELTSRRLIVLFGCGGDRDRTKRPRMRAAAERIADHVVVTSDNPRTEDPLKIIAGIMKGARRGPKFTVEPDRRAAIAKAVGMARAGDVVLLAGKGHEDYQIIGDERIHLDDREEARTALRTLARGRRGEREKAG